MSKTRGPVFRAAPYAAAVVLGVAVYLRSVAGPFIWDDSILIEQLKQHTSRGLWGIFTSGFLFRTIGPGVDFYRPLITISFLVDTALWRDNTIGFHLVNLLFHAISILGVALLTWLTLRSRVAALGAAFLFAVHPAHTESVAWVSGRTDVMCAAFLVSGACAYLAYRERRRTGFLILSLALVLMALLCKELALLAPVLFALLAWVAGERDYRRLIVDALPFAILAGAFFAIRSIVLPASPASGSAWPLATRAGIVAYSLYKHFQMMLLPHTAQIAYSETMDKAVAPGNFIALLCILVLAASLWSNRHWSRVPFFGIAWFLLTIVPVSGVAGCYTGGMVAQRFLYVPSVGLAVVFGWLMAEALHVKGRSVRLFGAAAGVFVIIALSLLSVRQSVLYTDEVLFWERFTADAPLADFAYFNLGIAYHKEGKYREAIRAFQGAVELNPDEGLAYCGIGRSYAALGDYDSAIENVSKALELQPGDPVAEGAMELLLRQKRAQSAPGTSSLD